MSNEDIIAKNLLLGNSCTNCWARNSCGIYYDKTRFESPKTAVFICERWADSPPFGEGFHYHEHNLN